VVSGGTPSTHISEFWDGDIPWVTPTDLGKQREPTLIRTARRISLAGLESSSAEIVPIGTILMSSRAPIGHLAVAGVACCTNQGCKNLIPGEQVDSQFLYFALKKAVPELKTLGSGATFAEVSKSIVESYRIPLPPLPEQKRIAAILTEQMAAVDQARAAAEEQLKVARTLLSAYLNSLFNSSEAKKWPKKQFGEMVDNFDGMRIPIKLDVRTKKKGPYPYYGASGIIDYIDEYIFDGNFLLIGEDGANLIYRSSPIAFRASGKFWVNNHAHVVQPKGDIPLDYLLYFFSITDLKPFVTGAAQPKLTQKDMNSIPVPFPPIAEQQHIVRMANNQMGILNKAQEKLQDQIDAIGKLPVSLLRRAFNGEM